MAANTSSNTSTHSRASLFGLSAELRNRIYELGLDEPATRIYHPILRPRLPRPCQPGLLLVSRQLRSEALGLYYHGLLLRLLLQPSAAGSPSASAKKFSTWMESLALRGLENFPRGAVHVVASQKIDLLEFQVEVVKFAVGKEWRDVVGGKGVVKMGYLDKGDVESVEGAVWLEELWEWGSASSILLGLGVLCCWCLLCLFLCVALC